MIVLTRLVHHIADAIVLVAHEVGSNLVQLVLQLAVGWLVGQ